MGLSAQALYRRQVAVAFIAGLIFGAGLIIGGMTQPTKVIGFLDIFGRWDASLAFVMGGAILIHAPLRLLIKKRRSQPLFTATFAEPTNRKIDARLLVGEVMFGVGWGLSGFCPGPAVTATGGGVYQALVVTIAMLGGMMLFEVVQRWWAQRGDESLSTSH